MAISYPIPFPTTCAIVSCDMYVQRNQTVERGDDGTPQTTRKLGDRWVGTVQIRLMTASEARDYLGWIAALQGMIGTFTMEHPDYSEAAGSSSGDTGRIKGGSQTGNAIDTDGWAANATFKRGDIHQIGATGAGCRLKMVMEDAQADGSGNVTLHYDPPVYTAHADNTTIYTENCKGYFQLSAPDIPMPSDKNKNFTLSIPFEEKL